MRPPPGLAHASLLGVILLAGSLTGCANREADPSSQFPRIVLVTLDTLNIRYTGTYNPEIGYTPHLDRLADRGVVFRHAFSPVGLTLPAHASLMTGQSPSTTRVLANGDVASPALTMVAERLAAVGYSTAAFVSLGVLKSRFGIAQGFGRYEDAIERPHQRWYNRAEEVVDAAMPWVTANRLDPFFMWIHLSDPHLPYLPKDPPPDAVLSLDGTEVSQWTLATQESFETEIAIPPGRHELAWSRLHRRHAGKGSSPRVLVELETTPSLESLLAGEHDGIFGRKTLAPSFSIELDNPGTEEVRLELRFKGRESNMSQREVKRRYELEVSYMDDHLGRLIDHFDRQGLGEDTLWIVVSDHGEGLFNHGVGGHAGWVYDDQLRIVWMMSGPTLPPGTVVDDAPARTEDVVPTLLDVIGMPEAEGLDGRSLTGCWSTPPCTAPKTWWAHNVSHTDQRVVAVAGYEWPLNWLWHEKRGAEAYDLVDDEYLRVNLLEHGEPPAPIETLSRGGSRLRSSLERQLKDNQATRGGDAESSEILKNLGYL